MIRLAEPFPLIVFLSLSRKIDTQIPLSWEGPFVAGALSAVAVVILFLYKRIIFNRILLGINIYLFFGGAAFITHQWWLNKGYGHLGASGMFLWIIIVGMTTSIFSSNGFIGVISKDSASIRTTSMALLMLSICAFAISFIFRGNAILSETIPFIGLIAAQNILKGRISTCNPAPRTN